MEQEVTRLADPIDGMLWIHKALRNEGDRIEELVRSYQVGDSLQPIRSAFNFWASVLLWHADQEDAHMTALLPDSLSARENEAEHAAWRDLVTDLNDYLTSEETKSLAERVRQAIIALHEQQHVELLAKLEDVMAVLGDEIGRTRVIARTHRHLYGRIVALRICQDDHLETEEAFILPEIKEICSESQQREIMRRLLIDDQAEDQRWIVDWIVQSLTLAEQRGLLELEHRF